MNKKYFKILKIVLLFLIIVFLIYNSYSYADLDVSSTADEFIQAGASAPSTGENRTAMNSAISDIAGLLTGLGIIVAVVTCGKVCICRILATKVSVIGV